ncbi:hypothetical protein CCAX7_47180 [Capsulimonas corticalis]|uniref:Uncharacterized protein n=1 Tax=Capsulimonas corticalis TaxID=2219043 RepID=A0A402CQ82_9BACT|nr:BON domain-containing protein [Capsulimonas corticalis]BDI32667.1 hypothetical protein CCAX7_47180 [Capsulimonas corticalis]
MMSTMPVMRRLCAVAFSAAIFAVAGCSHDDASQNQPPTVVTNTTTAPAVPAGTTTTVTTPGGTTTVAGVPQTNNTNAGPGGATGEDSAAGDAVLKSIHTNVQMTGSRVLATVDSAGTARLTGTAQNQQQKALAERLATNTSGVTSVVNKIEIVATGGVKSPPPPTKVVEKTKIVVVHDKAPAADTSANPPAPPADSTAPAAPSDSSSPTTAPAPTSSGN